MQRTCNECGQTDFFVRNGGIFCRQCGLEAEKYLFVNQQPDFNNEGRLVFNNSPTPKGILGSVSEYDKSHITDKVFDSIPKITRLHRYFKYLVNFHVQLPNRTTQIMDFFIQRIVNDEELKNKPYRIITAACLRHILRKEGRLFLYDSYLKNVLNFFPGKHAYKEIRLIDEFLGRKFPLTRVLNPKEIHKKEMRNCCQYWFNQIQKITGMYYPGWLNDFELNYNTLLSNARSFQHVSCCFAYQCLKSHHFPISYQKITEICKLPALCGLVPIFYYHPLITAKSFLISQNL